MSVGSVLCDLNYNWQIHWLSFCILVWSS